MDGGRGTNACRRRDRVLRPLERGMNNDAVKISREQCTMDGDILRKLESKLEILKNTREFSPTVTRVFIFRLLSVEM